MSKNEEPAKQMQISSKPTGLNDMPMEVLGMICEHLSPVYLKQFRLTNKKNAQAATRYLFQKLYITFCSDSYNNVIKISKDENLSRLVHEIVWDLREIQGALTNEFEFMLHFDIALDGMDYTQCKAFREVHHKLYGSQCSLKAALNVNMDAYVKSLREALQKFTVNRISMIQSGFPKNNILLPLRLESGMLYRHGTWSLPFYLYGRRTQHAVGNWPIKVALQCLVPCRKLFIMTYSGNFNTINALLAVGPHLRSSLPHIHRLEITLFSHHPGPYNWSNKGEIHARPRTIDSNRYCTQLESLDLGFIDCSEPDPTYALTHFKVARFGATMLPVNKEAYFPNLRILILEGFWMPVPEFVIFLRRHASTLQKVYVRRTFFMFGYLGEILEVMRETRMRIENGCFDDVMDNSWLRVVFHKITVKEDQLLDYVAGNGPNPCPRP
ncbi:predicted protein [Paecilomyces variotii No. 5]|uniref:F-box domain-containing protein n=1 Tax=Byssochlamys spectabilis (strain No. 5 / NBRC 109023) TaxID=1356009 RepID=V5GBN6_BYSSN|nr:predicted protein [Paecilomyces variotii No. 5]